MVIDGFDDLANMWREFEEEPQDDINLIIASYEYGSYEGEAYVIYEKEGKYYIVHGSHCSCYGLENQWQPEETSLEYLKSEKHNPIYEDYKDIFKQLGL